MEHVNLGAVIEQAISKFSQNRIGDKPPVFVTISPTLAHVPWRDRSLKDFARTFIYESLLTNHPDAAIEVALRQKLELKDLNKFVGVQPSHWVQLRSEYRDEGSNSWNIRSKSCSPTSATAAKNGLA